MAKDQEFQWLLTTDPNLVKVSLTSLQQKIRFILSYEFIHLNESQRLDVDPHILKERSRVMKMKVLAPKAPAAFAAIKKASAYYHETRCINKLI